MISIIVAIARNRAIGCHNRLLWHISEDLKHFKAVTMGRPVVMGRLTWESLGRPLPGRRNVVVTRNKDYKAEGAETVSSLEEAVALFPADEEVFIIGGGEIYRQAMPLADRMYITVVDADYEGDTFFPEWDDEEWRLVSHERFPRGEKFDAPFEFNEYARCLETESKG